MTRTPPCPRDRDVRRSAGSTGATPPAPVVGTGNRRVASAAAALAQADNRVALVEAALAQPVDDCRLTAIRGHVGRLYVELIDASAAAWRAAAMTDLRPTGLRNLERACGSMWSSARSFLRAAGMLEVLRAHRQRGVPGRLPVERCPRRTMAAALRGESSTLADNVTSLLLDTLPAEGVSFVELCDRLVTLVSLLVDTIARGAVADGPDTIAGTSRTNGPMQLAASIRRLAQIAVTVHAAQVHLLRVHGARRHGIVGHRNHRLQAISYDGLRDAQPGRMIPAKVTLAAAGGLRREAVVQLSTVHVGFGDRWVAFCPRCGSRCRELYEVEDDAGLVCCACSGTTLLSQRAGHRRWFRDAVHASGVRMNRRIRVGTSRTPHSSERDKPDSGQAPVALSTSR
jgi:hypothetical protein